MGRDRYVIINLFAWHGSFFCIITRCFRILDQAAVIECCGRRSRFGLCAIKPSLWCKGCPHFNACSPVSCALLYGVCTDSYFCFLWDVTFNTDNNNLWIGWVYAVRPDLVLRITVPDVNSVSLKKNPEFPPQIYSRLAYFKPLAWFPYYSSPKVSLRDHICDDLFWLY